MGNCCAKVPQVASPQPTSPPSAPKACPPAHEQLKLRSLQELGTVGWEKLPKLQGTLALLRDIFACPVACVSLLEDARVVFPFWAGPVRVDTIPRQGSSTQFDLLANNPALLTIEDAKEDTRFSDHPLLAGPPPAYFYAGAALVAAGQRVGTLCILDYKPRHFSAEQYSVLANFAEMVARELERNTVCWSQQEQLQASMKQRHLLRALDRFSKVVCLVDCNQPQWPILYASGRQRWAALTGVGQQEGILRDAGFWGLFSPRSVTLRDAPAAQLAGDAEQQARSAAAGQQAFTLVACRSGASAALEADSSADGEQGTLLQFTFRSCSNADSLGSGSLGIRRQESWASSQGKPAPQSAGGLALSSSGSRQQSEQLTAAAAAGAVAAAGTAAAAAAMVAGAAEEGRNAMQSEELGLSHSSTGSVGLPFAGVAEAASDEGHYYAVVQPYGSPTALQPTLSTETCSSGGGGVNSAGASSGFDYSSWYVMPPAATLSGHLDDMCIVTRPLSELLKQVQLGPLLGAGSFGCCYKGWWQGSRVAVKVVQCSFDAGQEGASFKAVLREALLSRSLAHPHIVKTFDYAVGEKVFAEGRYVCEIWLVQSYCNRGTLLSAMKKGLLKCPDGTPSLECILRTARDIAGAMQYLHAHGVIHGDLSLQNVLCTSSSKDSRRWVAQVADFGLSRALGQGSIHTTSLRTVTHMPPELLVDGTLSPAVDVYSFGVQLCEMWTGQRAWKGATVARVMASAAAGAFFRQPDDAPVELQDLMRRCICPEPSGRPTFKEILSELNDMVSSLRRTAQGAKAAAAED